MEGKRAVVSTLAAPPQVLVKRHPGGKKTLVKDNFGNLAGTDNDFASFLCEGLKCDSFLLRTTLGNQWDHYSQKDQKWKGRIGEVIDGSADFTLGNLDHAQSGLMATSFTGYLYHSEIGFVTGHPKIVLSLYNITKPFT